MAQSRLPGGGTGNDLPAFWPMELCPPCHVGHLTLICGLRPPVAVGNSPVLAVVLLWLVNRTPGKL